MQLFLRLTTTLGLFGVLGACGAAGDGKPDAPTAKGPGAVLRCQSSASGANAFDTYGATAFVAVNEEIFTLVGTEVTTHGASNLGDSFGKIGSGNPASTTHDAATFKGNLAAFLVFAYGGPTEITYTDGKTYAGEQDMPTAHTGLNITAAQYDYFIANIVVPALINKGVKHGAGTAADPNDISSCFAPVVTDPSFKASIVGK